MRIRFAYVAFIVYAVANVAQAQPANPAEPANPPQNPTPTGPAVPSDVKQPPPPHKVFDFTVYGRVNVSFDVGNQELTTAQCLTGAVGGVPSCAGTPPQGNLRWLPDLASNLSRFGVRGYHDITDRDFQFVFQIETQVDVTATPGSKPNGNNDTINPGNTAVAGSLGSRNSYVGIATPYGAIKLGKNDTPYKSVTADFDFLGETPGDYNSIMGNTGGDNRTEFDSRLPHAIWYESPDVMGFRLNAIWSPGQNRFADDSGYAIGENTCAGGNAGPCTDGSFGDAYGASLEWHGFGLKLIASHEMHKKTNRTGDAGQTTPSGATSVVGIADEYAWKFGAKYTFAPTGTTVDAIFEEMRRNDVAAFNERQRDGYFIAAEQKLGRSDEVMGSLTHASNTLGDPGLGPVDNASTMLAAGYRHWFSTKTSIILTYAHMSNGPAAHFALGPGGHGVTWDCKDGSGPSTGGSVGATPGSTAGGIGFVGNGTGCFTGTSPQAFSLGMVYDF